MAFHLTRALPAQPPTAFPILTETFVFWLNLLTPSTVQFNFQVLFLQRNHTLLTAAWISKPSVNINLLGSEANTYSTILTLNPAKPKAPWTTSHFLELFTPPCMIGYPVDSILPALSMNQPKKWQFTALYNKSSISSCLIFLSSQKWKFLPPLSSGRVWATSKIC